MAGDLWQARLWALYHKEAVEEIENWLMTTFGEDFPMENEQARAALAYMDDPYAQPEQKMQGDTYIGRNPAKVRSLGRSVRSLCESEGGCGGPSRLLRGRKAGN